MVLGPQQEELRVDAGVALVIIIWCHALVDVALPDSTTLGFPG